MFDSKAVLKDFHIKTSKNYLLRYSTRRSDGIDGTNMSGIPFAFLFNLGSGYFLIAQIRKSHTYTRDISPTVQSL